MSSELPDPMLTAQGGWTETSPSLEHMGPPATAPRTTGASVLRGGLWSMASKVLPQLFTLAISIAGARFLGPAGLGRQSYIAFVAASAVTVLGFGMPLSLMRQVGECVGARSATRARGLVRWAWKFSWIGTVAGFSGILAIGLAGGKPRLAWILAAGVVAAGLLNQIPDAVISGLQRWRDSSIVYLAASAATAVGTIVVLSAGGGIEGMFAIQLAAALVILGFMLYLSSKRLVVVAPISEDPGDLRGRTLRYAGSAMLGSLLTLVIFRRSEFFFLNHYANNSDIARYSVAFSLMTSLVLFPQALANAVAPAVATVFGAREMTRIRSGYSRTLRLMLLASLPVVAAGLSVGPQLLVALFGHSFEGSRLPLLVLLAPFPLIPLMNSSYSLIVGMRRMLFPLLSGAVSALVNVLLDFALIPRFHVVGAAVANSIAQGFTAVVILLYGLKLVGGAEWEFSAVLRMATASCVSGLTAWLVLSALGGWPGLIVGSISGVAAFAALGTTIGVLPRADAEWIEAEFGSVMRGFVGFTSRSFRIR
jgi:O-antigen/teichoic acid export membrane protein